jgi:hypothetical protein
MLTTNPDSFTGGTGNDTFLGAAGSTDTFSIIDTLDGGGGTDTANIVVDDDTALAVGTVKNIENFFIRNVDTGADGLTVNFASIDGEAQAWNDRSTDSVTFNNLATGTTVGVKGDGNINVAATSFSMATAANPVSIAIADGVKGGATITNASNAATGATISSSGAASTVGAIQLSAGATVTATTIAAAGGLTTGNITGHKADATMTITGAGKASIGTLEAAVDTVDASGNEGGVTLVLDAEFDTKFTGGKGADSVTTGGAVLTTGSVNAGDGTDTLIVANTTDITAATGAKYTNFETLQANNGTAVNLDHVAGITAVRINDGAGTTSVTNLTAAQAGAITAVAGNANGAITIGVKGAATVGQIDTVKITADDGATTTSTVALGTPVIADVENLELTAVDNITVAGLTDAESLNSIKLLGAGTIGLTSGAITPEANTVVDGSAATGVLTIDFGGVTGAATTAASSFIGGSKGDTITTTGGAADLVNGKAGIDTITVTKDIASSGFATVQSEAIVSADSDLITDFVSTENKFDFNGTLANGTGAGAGIAATEVASAATIAAALATGDAANDIVFIATTDLTGAQETALDAAVTGGMTAAEADAVIAALVGTGGALNGAIANLDTVLGVADSVLFQFSTDSDTMLVRVTNTDVSGTNTLTASEVQLVGVFAATTDLVAGDFV